MNKYIQDSIRNNSRSIIADLTRPQQKSVSEIIRGLYTAGKPILKNIAQDKSKTAKKQAEKYSRHLGNITLKDKVDKLALKIASKKAKNDTIIAYDLTDISKESAQKIENISPVFDGSRRNVTNGFLLHGVGINNILVKFEVHNNGKYTTNHIRKEIIKKISGKLKRKGIWVFDRGNDGKQFFVNLRQKLKVKFICRLRDNRHVVIKETGDIMKIRDMQEGMYRIYLLNPYNTKIDKRYVYTLVIHKHLKDQAPIRLLTNLKTNRYTEEDIITMYLQRWGIENIFKRAKQKFELERIRVLKYKKFINLVSLIQLVVNISTIIFVRTQQVTNFLTTGVLNYYKRFIKLKSLGFNLDSFITFMKATLPPLIIRKITPQKQLTLFSRRCLEKLGLF